MEETKRKVRKKVSAALVAERCLPEAVKNELSEDELVERVLHVNRLRLQDCGLTTVDGIEVYSEATHVDLRSNCIDDLDGLDLLPKMYILLLSDNGLSSLDSISTCEGLKYLNIANNSITDFDVILNNAPKNLEFIDLAGNPCWDNGDQERLYAMLIHQLPLLRRVNRRSVRTAERIALPSVLSLKDGEGESEEQLKSRGWESEGSESDDEEEEDEEVSEGEEVSDEMSGAGPSYETHGTDFDFDELRSALEEIVHGSEGGEEIDVEKLQGVLSAAKEQMLSNIRRLTTSTNDRMLEMERETEDLQEQLRVLVKRSRVEQHKETINLLRNRKMFLEEMLKSVSGTANTRQRDSHAPSTSQ